eukprot:2045599-Rhodomonas_salina.1
MKKGWRMFLLFNKAALYREPWLPGLVSLTRRCPSLGGIFKYPGTRVAARATQCGRCKKGRIQL